MIELKVFTKITISGDRPKHDLDKILDFFTIEEIVSDYVDLEVSGNDFIGLCPLHDDLNTKSLRVYTTTNSFWCFGCQKGGSIFDFLMNVENLSFGEVVEILANRAGISADQLDTDLVLPKDPGMLDFEKFREKIEREISLKTKNILNNRKKSCFIINNILLLYNEFDNFWLWYDKSQRFFNKRVLTYKKMTKEDKTTTGKELLDFLNQKLQSFYSLATRKLETLECN
jgi:hypothetical protein